MANACIEINTSRDIARQILRHRSFSFQEFSQRYAGITALPTIELREARLQDEKHRQSSLETKDEYLSNWWQAAQANLEADALRIYSEALQKGIAKEVARVVLPEGLTASRMYMNGTIRSWMHYVQLRKGKGTQKEHRLIAEEIDSILAEQLPLIWKGLE